MVFNITGTALRDPYRGIVSQSLLIWDAGSMYGAIPVDDWLSDVLAINDDVVCNAIRIHQV